MHLNSFALYCTFKSSEVFEDSSFDNWNCPLPFLPVRVCMCAALVWAQAHSISSYHSGLIYLFKN